MICTIHQPNYFPYPGFFEKASRSDVFILYDTTQFIKNGWQNRNKICTKDGWQWLSLPVVHRSGQYINEIKIHEPLRSLKKNWNTIKTVYGQAPFFKMYSAVFESFYSRDYVHLSTFNTNIIRSIADILGLKTRFILSSELQELKLRGTEALIALCKIVNADTYISGISGKNYVNEKLFEEANIKLVFQNYSYPVYSQFNNKVFQPMMSIIDVMFNCGSTSLNVITHKL